MDFKRFSVFGLSVLLVCFVFVPSWAQTVLLEENWDSGTIDGAKWTTSNPAGTVVQLEDLGGGDFAIYTQVDDELQQRQANFYSVDTFSRGNDIYCEFLAWGDTNNSFRGWFNQKFPLRAQVAGPWRQNNNAAQHYFKNVEACFTHWILGTRNWSGFGGDGYMRLDEGGQFNTGNPADIKYVVHFINATEKSKAVLHRVYLDDAQGARFQWSPDGGTTWNLINDSRGLAGGTQTSGLHVGFGTNSTAVFIDDIRVVSGDGSPAVPIQTNTIAGSPLLDEDWNSGSIDHDKWSVSLEFESLFESGMYIGLDEFDPAGFPGDFSMNAEGQTTSLVGSIHHTAFFAIPAFYRGGNLTCEFKIWRDTTRVGWGGTPNQSYMVGGPWKKNKHNLMLNNQEAMIRYWIPWTPAGQGQEFAQPNDQSLWTISPKLSQGYHLAFDNSASRELCMTVQVILGDTHGARIRWNSPGQFQTSFLTEYDNRGVPPDVGSSSSNQVYAGWGSYSGRMFWDDILITNDQSSGPTHTPTIAPTPTETAFVGAVENWDQLE